MEYESWSRERESMYDMTARKSCSSLHGYLRTMQRAKKNSRQAIRFIRNAWSHGKRINELQMLKQRVYASRYNSLLPDGYTNLRIYDSYLFIFSPSGKLITMHSLPKYFFKKNHYDGKTRIRDRKKYARFYPGEMCADSCELI